MAEAEAISTPHRVEKDDIEEEDFKRMVQYDSAMALIGGGLFGIVGIAVAAVVYMKFRNRHYD